MDKIQSLSPRKIPSARSQPHNKSAIKCHTLLKWHRGTQEREINTTIWLDTGGADRKNFVEEEIIK